MRTGTLVLVIYFGVSAVCAATGPELSRRSFLIGAAAVVAAPALPALPARPGIIIIDELQNPSPILLRSLADIQFMRPLPPSAIKTIVDHSLRPYGLSVEQFLTDEAFERFAEIYRDRGAGAVVRKSLRLLTHYRGEPFSLDEIRFHFEGVPLPEARRSSVLTRLRQRLLSSCAPLLSLPGRFDE